MSTVDCLYHQALSTPLLHLEDVFLTGILADKCNVARETTNLIFPNRMSSSALMALGTTNFALVHYVHEQMKLDLHRRLYERDPPQ